MYLNGFLSRGLEFIIYSKTFLDHLHHGTTTFPKGWAVTNDAVNIPKTCEQRNN